MERMRSLLNVGLTKRISEGLAYDPRQPTPLLPPAIVLFGGSGNGAGEPADSTPAAPLPDTWTHDRNLQSAWQQCANNLCPQDQPVRRTSPAMAFGAATAQMLMFGGNGSASPLTVRLGDTWFFNRAQPLWWSQCTGPTCTPVTTCASTVTPCPRDGQRMSYDSAREQLFLFGGQGIGNVSLNDTWFWNGQWAKCGTANGCPVQMIPAVRCCVGLAFDSAVNKVVLFGGAHDVTPQAYGDTWTWEPTVGWHCETPDRCNLP